MACAEAAGILYDFLDGALPPAERQRLAGHLQACPLCRESVRQIRCTLVALGRLPRQPMPDRLKSKLLSHLRQAADAAPPGTDVRRTPATLHPAQPARAEDPPSDLRRPVITTRTTLRLSP
jgi:anti-sigma factor RsiW